MARNLQYRPSTWFDTTKHAPVFGIEAQEGSSDWLNLAEGGKPLIYDSEEERDAKLRELEQSHPRLTQARAVVG